MRDAVEIEILQDAVETKVEVTAAMLLMEARRRGKMRIRIPAGIFTIIYDEANL